MGDLETVCVVQHGRPAVRETFEQLSHEPETETTPA
jgi:hypothetical protein